MHAGDLSSDFSLKLHPDRAMWTVLVFESVRARVDLSAVLMCIDDPVAGGPEACATALGLTRMNSFALVPAARPCALSKLVCWCVQFRR